MTVQKDVPLEKVYEKAKAQISVLNERCMMMEVALEEEQEDHAGTRQLLQQAQEEIATLKRLAVEVRE